MINNTNRKIKVLVCDDSAILRRLTKQALQSYKELEVIGEAANGQAALDFIKTTRPDVVLLDVEMPVMDGVDALKRIRKTYGKLPVIMFSSITTGRQSEATIDALEAGANDFVSKPSSVGSLQTALQHVGKDLHQKIIAITRTAPVARIVTKAPPKSGSDFIKAKDANIQAVGIGASTGGPAALAKVVSDLQTGLNVPMFITQHMPASFIAPMAKKLTQVGSYEVIVAQENMIVKAGEIYIAPGDRHLGLTRKDNQVIIRLNDGPPIHSCKPAVDPMFDAIAGCYGKFCLGVVLTGMGKDGRDGSRTIKDRGGVIITQDEQSCVVYGMPREVAEAGYSDRTLPIEQIGAEISQFASFSSSTGSLIGAAASAK